MLAYAFLGMRFLKLLSMEIIYALKKTNLKTYLFLEIFNLNDK
jgi:hypothetical protein